MCPIHRAFALRDAWKVNRPTGSFSLSPSNGPQKENTMPEQNKPFVVTDRRKFTLDGEPRPDADPSPEKVRPTVPPPPTSGPDEIFGSSAKVIPQSSSADRHTTIHDAAEDQASEQSAAGASAPRDSAEYEDPNAPPPPTQEQLEQSRIAFEATAERLDIAIRSANPGIEHPPAMSFERLVQSVYMTSIMQLGGGTPEGQKPQLDLMGAKQSIDMLTVIAEKTASNLTGPEQTLIDSALFELRLAFLDVTQALARSAAAKQPPPGFGGQPGPSIVR